MQAAPLLKDLVLVGGGHSHVHVLKSFGMKPMPGVRLTLIGRDIETPYSGMIPGFVAGHYSFDECHIDLAQLAHWTGVRLIQAEAIGVDRIDRQVLLKDRPPVSYDLLSLDVGSAPSLDAIPGAAEHATPVKPIADLGRRWLAFLERMKEWRGPLRIAVIGGGAGGVELALAIDHRLREVAAGADVERDARHARRDPGRQRRLGAQEDARDPGAPRHPPDRERRDNPHRARRRPSRDRRCGWKPTRCSSSPRPVPPSGSPTPALRSTNAASSPSSRRCARPATSDIFAVGDCATVLAHRRPKAGVFAVRQGPPLAENLRRALLGQTLEPFTPQRRYLSILGTGDGRAVATRGGWSIEGAWVWRWKDYIDRKWMRMYCEPPASRRPMNGRDRATRSGTGRCRSQAPAGRHRHALRRLRRQGRCLGADTRADPARPLAGSGVTIGLDAPDDAAMIEVPAGKALVQSVDFFRTFIDDPFAFGEVAAVHALGDVWAMGARAHSALALAVVPAAAERLMEEDLFQMLSGARRVLDQAGCALIGGHSGEGPEAALGFSVNGLVDPARALRKGGLRPGDKLVLTKPLGTGVIFAAAMRGAARGTWIASALASMRKPSSEAAEALVAAGAHACTDVTGFGLAGHLAEMIRASTR